VARDQKINLLLWLAAAALAVALMAGSYLVESFGPYLQWALFIGGLLLALVLFSIAVSMAWQDEQATPQPKRKPKMIALAGMIIFGLGFLGCAAWFFWPAQTQRGNSAQAIARLTELGWTVKPSNTDLLFEVSSHALPRMQESARYFSEIKRSFRLHFQQVPSLNGLHFLADIAECKSIEINAGTFTNLSELSGFTHLENLVISQTPFDKPQAIDPSPLASLINLRSLSLNRSRIRSVAFLEPLKKLQTLNLGGTLISDVSPLAELKDLRSLEIRDTRATDLQPLKELDQLTDLTISGAQVPGLASLFGFPPVTS